MSLFFLVIFASYYLDTCFSMYIQKTQDMPLAVFKLWDDLVYALLVEFTRLYLYCNTLLKDESLLRRSTTRRIRGLVQV